MTGLVPRRHSTCECFWVKELRKAASHTRIYWPRLDNAKSDRDDHAFNPRDATCDAGGSQCARLDRDQPNCGSHRQRGESSGKYKFVLFASVTRVVVAVFNCVRIGGILTIKGSCTVTCTGMHAVLNVTGGFRYMPRCKRELQERTHGEAGERRR